MLRTCSKPVSHKMLMLSLCYTFVTSGMFTYVSTEFLKFHKCWAMFSRFNKEHCYNPWNSKAVLFCMPNDVWTVAMISLYYLYLYSYIRFSVVFFYFSVEWYQWNLQYASPQILFSYCWEDCQDFCVYIMFIHLVNVYLSCWYC